MGILLGLLTAIAWGASDFLARFATQKFGTFRTMLYMQSTGFVFMTLALPWLGGWGHLADGSGLHPWLWGVLAGALNTIATLALYRSFEIGKMSVVAPISAAYPVVTILLSVLSGERLTVIRTAGIICTLLGVIVVARGEKVPEKASDEDARRSGKGVGWAVCAALGFGVLFWLLGIYILPRLGSAPTVWAIRLTCAALVILVMIAVKQPMKLPLRAGNGYLVLLSMGVLDTSAYLLNNYGMRMEQVAVISVLASLYGAVTVAFAALFLREHVSRWQWSGIVAVFAGIVLISF